MKILVFTEKQDYYKVIRLLADDLSRTVDVELVTECELVNLALSNPHDLIVIDDREYHRLNDGFLEELKINHNEVMVFLQDKSALNKYLQYNVVDYFISPVNWDHVNDRLRECVKKMTRYYRFFKSPKEPQKFLLKRKTDVILLEYDRILFFEKKDKRVLIHTYDQVYESHDSLKSIMAYLPDTFLRVHSSYVVNFNHVHEIIELRNRSYAITFKAYDQIAHMSRHRAAEIMDDAIAHFRLSYIGHRRKDK
jgi:two-component system LytT family response regulator